VVAAIIAFATASRKYSRVLILYFAIILVKAPLPSNVDERKKSAPSL
jgi:hypothetical protein